MNWKFWKKNKEEHKAEEEPECRHDWEIINTYYLKDVVEGVKLPSVPNLVAGLDDDGDVCIGFGVPYSAIKGPWYVPFGHFNLRFYDYGWVSTVSQKVCLNCGECVDEVEIITKHIRKKMYDYIDEEREKHKRKQIAKRMWEDCKHD